MHSTKYPGVEFFGNYALQRSEEAQGEFFNFDFGFQKVGG
jgi:hypothetical protein